MGARLPGAGGGRRRAARGARVRDGARRGRRAAAGGARGGRVRRRAPEGRARLVLLAHAQSARAVRVARAALRRRALAAQRRRRRVRERSRAAARPERSRVGGARALLDERLRRVAHVDPTRLELQAVPLGRSAWRRSACFEQTIAAQTICPPVVS